MLKFAGGALALFMATALSATAATVDVKMQNSGYHGYSFEPAIVYIHSGDSVHFVPTSKGHNAQSIPGMTPDGAEPINVPFSQEKTVQFTKPGLYGYKCLPHAFMGMVGLIVVDNANNEAQARKVKLYGGAKRHFDELFQELDSKKQ